MLHRFPFLSPGQAVRWSGDPSNRSLSSAVERATHIGGLVAAGRDDEDAAGGTGARAGIGIDVGIGIGVGFVERASIYTTASAVERWEHRARANVAAELAELSGAG